ncbi:hypothetical protein BDV95DRAFT_672899 [Massariosphaeria phaeospora]|uniref:BTB domain-containing protein n=1 Tax=Massariosphaeria phaeospora TaxID=100035 RepID=A0A7C8I145_9PLEO|nr:hypothetical protein BDV95DRAFT_672899 [Massariosphaeria phaeospora]
MLQKSGLHMPALGDRMVNITVVNGGASASETHTVHNNLVYTSGYLQNHLASLDKKVTPQLTFHRGRRPVFNVYLHWLYHRTILTIAELCLLNGHKDTRSEAEIAYHDFEDLVLCWGFGHMLQDDRFKDMVMSAIVGRVKHGSDQAQLVQSLTPQNVKTIYEVTSPESPLRAFLADAVVQFAVPEQVQYFGKNHPIEFISTVLVKYSQALSQAKAASDGQVKKVAFLNDTAFPDECVFHEHTKTNRPCWRRALWA